MSNMLDKIENTKDIKKLSFQEKNELAQELREMVLQTVSKNGGHLASNLGVVELTIALHSVFDVPKDKIVWDVGHQTYVHKILTGRKKQMDTLRKLDGIAGFPKVSESETDCFNTGHSSTSISAALGMARARDIKKEKHHVIAVIGDGALTGGMALEAMDDAGGSLTDVIVVLNDNEMSISKNVGGISNFLSKTRTRKWYQKSNQTVKKIVKKIPYLGDKIITSVRKLKRGIKQLVIPNMIFEDMGFTYLGPVDGHHVEKMEYLFEKCKELKGPILVHVITKKGKGYEYAEKNPDRYHSTSSFDIKTGKSTKEKKKDYSAVFGDTILELAKNNDKIVAVTAAMRDGTGLRKFAETYPERFFDVGIAEQHAITMAAGMAATGMIPIVPIYSSFYQRGYDQMIHDVCMQNLPVILCADRAGIVGNDGETHQGILDLSFCNIIPNLTIMAPKDFEELRNMLKYAVTLQKPVFIRYPRGGEEITFQEQEKLEEGKPEIIKKGNDISIIAIGKMVGRAWKVAEILKEKGVSCEIINMRFLKPIQKEELIKSIQKTKRVVTIEDNILKGGLASTIIELVDSNVKEPIAKMHFGYPEQFIKQGSCEEIEKRYGLNVENIAEMIEKRMKKNE